MPSFYFEQLLQNGLNGIDQQGITGAVLQIAGVILILSLLWPCMKRTPTAAMCARSV